MAKRKDRKAGYWQCRHCGNQDYCPYIDEECWICGSKEGLIFK